MILFEATSRNFSGRVRLPKEAYGRAGRRMSAMAAVSIRKPSWPEGVSVWWEREPGIISEAGRILFRQRYDTFFS